MKRLSWLLPAVLAAAEPTVKIQGELKPYLAVDVIARVEGFVEEIRVDRGSSVKKGDVIVRLSAPEMEAQAVEAQSQVLAIRARQAEVNARKAAAESTIEKLKIAAKTPGAIAANEIVVAEKGVEALDGETQAIEQQATAAQRHADMIDQLKDYLTITAPFDGVVTERMAHPGALAGPRAGALLRIEQLGRLRLVAAVPESLAGPSRLGRKVTFRVPAYPGQTFTGTIARQARALDQKTRTMPVEIDIVNTGGRLGPGMYAEIDWFAPEPKPESK
jgi:membrane fusion protein (multidrug efflux system)